MKFTESQLMRAARAAERADALFEGDVHPCHENPAYWRFIALSVLGSLDDEELTQTQRDLAITAARRFAGPYAPAAELEAAVDAALATLKHGSYDTVPAPEEDPLDRAERTVCAWERAT